MGKFKAYPYEDMTPFEENFLDCVRMSSESLRVVLDLEDKSASSEGTFKVMMSEDALKERKYLYALDGYRLRMLLDEKKIIDDFRNDKKDILVSKQAEFLLIKKAAEHAGVPFDKVYDHSEYSERQII